MKKAQPLTRISGKTRVPFGGAANELCLIFMKLHGKLLICARNESVELDRLMNIHLDFSTRGLIGG